MIKTSIVFMMFLSVSVHALRPIAGKKQTHKMVATRHRFVDLSSITEPVIVNETGAVFKNPTVFWKAMREQKRSIGEGFLHGLETDRSNPFESDAIENWKDADTTEYEVTGFDEEYQQNEVRISFQILDHLHNKLHVRLGRAADCGAGIGRVTNHLLAKRFDKVDLFERSTKLIEFARESLAGNPHVGEFFNSDLKDIKFNHKYDVIWVQMVTGYFDDEELVAFYKKCKDALTQNGVVVFKDFVSPIYSLHIKLRLAEVFRSRAYNKVLFKEAGFEVVYTSALDPADIDSYTQLVGMVLKPKSSQDHATSPPHHH
jgi:protein N-terminal methyltransferase